MQKNLNLRILTADKKIYNGNIKKLSLETVLGKMEILPNHIDLITLIVPSITKFIDMDNNEHSLFTSEGVIRVTNGDISMECNSAEWPDEIDENRAEAAKERAENRLKDKTDRIDNQRAELSFNKAMLRLKTKNK